MRMVAAARCGPQEDAACPPPFRLVTFVLMFEPLRWQTLTPRATYALLTIGSCLLLAPISCIVELSGAGASRLASANTPAAFAGGKLALLLLFTGLLQYLSNEIAFCTLSMIHPVTYAVASTLKRSIVVGASLIFFGQRLPPSGADPAALGARASGSRSSAAAPIPAANHPLPILSPSSPPVLSLYPLPPSSSTILTCSSRRLTEPDLPWRRRGGGDHRRPHVLALDTDDEEVTAVIHRPGTLSMVMKRTTREAEDVRMERASGGRRLSRPGHEHGAERAASRMTGECPGGGYLEDASEYSKGTKALENARLTRATYSHARPCAAGESGRGERTRGARPRCGDVPLDSLRLAWTIGCGHIRASTPGACVCTVCRYRYR